MKTAVGLLCGTTALECQMEKEHSLKGSKDMIRKVVVVLQSLNPVGFFVTRGL